MKIQATLLTCLAAGTSLQPAFSADKDQPNILIIMTDQMRADLCQREGFPLNTTPFLDQMAGNGCWFNKAYTTAPASVPARTSFFTGRFPKATRVRSNHNIQDVVYEKDMFDVMKDAGYRTALLGKNHTYLDLSKTDFHGGRGAETPDQKAFGKFLQSLNSYVSFNPSPLSIENQHPYRMVDDAMGWIKEDDKPFFMLFSMSEPHPPYQVCEPYFSMFSPESLPPVRADITTIQKKGKMYEDMHKVMLMGHPDYLEKIDKIRSVYYGSLRMVDDQVKRFVEELKKQGKYDNTIIVFLADHGDYVGEYGLIKKGVGVSDVLSRIPMIWYGPGIKASPEPSSAHISIVDLFPTFCEIAGVEIPMGVQGRSLWNLLQGKSYPMEEFESVMGEQGYGGAYYTDQDDTDYVGEGCLNIKRGAYDSLNSWTQSGSQRLVRMGDWKLIYDMEGNGEMYHLKSDPSEINDLYTDPQYNHIKMELLQQLLKWEIATQDPLPIPRNRYHFKRNPHNYLFVEEN